MPAFMLGELEGRAVRAGLNLFGVVDAERFDASQPAESRTSALMPGCGTVVLLGSGGSEFWENMVKADGRPLQPSRSRHPIQDFAVKRAQDLAQDLEDAGHRTRIVQPEDRRSLNFVQLAEAAGFGTVSPVIGILLHPRYGPWVSLRAALLVEGKPFGLISESSITATFQPCLGCDKPCIAACPVGVHDGFGGHDFHRCRSHRHAGNCTTGCSVRRACPVGAEHRYPPEEEAHRHAYSLYAMEKWYGLGAWRFVPRFLRR